jgi:transmembrane sensor
MLRTLLMEIDKFKKKLNRYLKDQSNETENALIEAWYKSYEANERELGEDEIQRIGQAMHSKVDAAISKPAIINLPIFRIAASVIIAGGISLMVWFFSNKRKDEKDEFYTIQTGTNGVKQINLPDSSVIWLNAASCLRVPVSFKGHLREVKLVEGEAFFDVKRNPQHPFIVHIADLNVQVLGTSFNIRGYKNLNAINIAVATGKVGVTKGKHTLAMLLPGQQLSYNTNTSIYHQQLVNIDQMQGWKSGYTYLTQVKFEELALIIKNIFGLSLSAGNSRVNAYRFSLRVQHNIPADQILKVISQIHNTQYRKEGDKVILY